jgi:hypothetical protein
VTRAVEKLRGFFTKRGVTLTATVLTAAISANSVQAAPLGLAATVTATAVKGTLISATLTTLVNTTMKTMTWIKYKFAISFGATLLLAAGATTIALSQSQPTVYSLLANPPIIASATVEKEINFKTMPPGIPAGAQKQTFTFSKDGENYRMDFGGGMVGKYGDLMWQTTGEQVTRYNLKWNKIDTDASGIGGADTGARGAINTLLTFGLSTEKELKGAWNPDHKRFTFHTEYGNDYVANFSEENDLPVSAAVRNLNTSTTEWTVVYHYAPEFFGGKLPVAIIRYWGEAANEDKRIESIRIQSLDISKHHLPAAKLDPDKFLISTNVNYMPLFYSNNIPYWTDAKGRVRKVLTVEENEKEIQRIKASQKK